MSRILCFLVPCICVMASNAAHAALVYNLEFQGAGFSSNLHRWEYGGGRFIVADGFQGEVTSENVNSVFLDWSIRFTSPYNPDWPFRSLEHPGRTTYVLTRANSSVRYTDEPNFPAPKLVVGPDRITLPADSGYLIFDAGGQYVEFGPGTIALWDFLLDPWGYASYGDYHATSPGLPVPTTIATAVPEPTAGLLVSLCLLGGCAFQRRRPAAG